MAKAPEWLADLTPAAQRAQFGASQMLKARHILQARQISDLEQDPGHISAMVHEPLRHLAVTIRQEQGELRSTCPCDQDNCVHAAATVLAHLDMMGTNDEPRWRMLLHDMIPASVDEAPPAAPSPGPIPDAPDVGTPLGLRVERARGNWVALRVLSREGDGWVTTGLTWQSLGFDYANEYRPAHKHALRELLATRANTHHQTLATLALNDLTPQAWAALGHAVDAGVELLGTDGRHVTLDSFDLALGIERDGEHLLLASSVLSEGQPLNDSITLVGAPIHGLLLEDVDRVTLGGFTRPPNQLERNFLHHERPLRIPASDAGQLARFLPVLRNHADVHLGDGVDLPEASEARLVVALAPSTSSQAAAEATLLVDLGSDRFPLREAEPWHDPTTTEQLLADLPPELTVEGPLTPVEYAELHAWLTGQQEVAHELAAGLSTPRAGDDEPAISLRITDDRDWFDLRIEVSIAGEPIPIVDLMTALASGAEALMLDSGTWFRLDVPALDELRRLLEEARDLSQDSPSHLRIRPEHVSIWEDLTRLGVVAHQSGRWRRSAQALLGQEPEDPPEVPEGVEARLRPYQRTGHAWLDFRWRTGLGGILADEMGLGKTLQSLSLLMGLKERGLATEPALVVAPASVLGTWRLEAMRFTPSLRVVVITDTSKRRGHSIREAMAGADLVVTSYTLLRLEADDYAALRFSTVLLDEAQFVKNRNSITYKSVRRLRAQAKFAMTGTPLENRLNDLWSLLSITSPGLFPDPKRFDEAFAKPIEAGEREPLGRLLRRVDPLLLRRTKAQVASDLPPKQEQVVQVRLSPAHRRLYDKHLTAIRSELLGLVDDMQANRFTILRSLTKLRQLSLAPQLIDPASTVDAAKLDVLVDMVSEVVAEGHRALVFSSFTGFLRLAEERLNGAGFSNVYLDGSTRDRASRIEAFQNGDDPLFLISLKAGGFGLNLTQADYVFILDPWWNPAAESQAIDRTHRIGQDKHVFVYRLVSTGTIEDKVVAFQQHKRLLFDAVVSDRRDSTAPISGTDVLELLEPY